MKCPLKMKGLAGSVGLPLLLPMIWARTYMYAQPHPADPLRLLAWHHGVLMRPVVLLLHPSYLQGFGFGGTGKKSNNRRFDSYGEPFGLGDTIGCFVDRPNGAIKFTKNGKDLGTAFDISSVKVTSQHCSVPFVFTALMLLCVLPPSFLPSSCDPCLVATFDHCFRAPCILRFA